jgi:hypothetical protein
MMNLILRSPAKPGVSKDEETFGLMVRDARQLARSSP